MTIESAASLPGHGQEAFFPTSRYWHPHGRVPVMRRMPAASTPRRHLPRIALADDPPRGRVLVAADQPSLVLEVQRILRDAGYRAVGPAGSAEEAARLAARRPIDAAIVDLAMRSAASVAERLVEEGIPLVWLTDGSASPSAHDRAAIVRKPVTSVNLIQALERRLSAGQGASADSFYPVPPPQPVWPRVFPPL
ncbi:MAG: hypothetical protein WCP68_10590 [Enhydrobacter sp.]